MKSHPHDHSRARTRTAQRVRSTESCASPPWTRVQAPWKAPAQSCPVDPSSAKGRRQKAQGQFVTVGLDSHRGLLSPKAPVGEEALGCPQSASRWPCGPGSSESFSHYMG